MNENFKVLPTWLPSAENPHADLLSRTHLKKIWIKNKWIRVDGADHTLSIIKSRLVPTGFFNTLKAHVKERSMRPKLVTEIDWSNIFGHGITNEREVRIIFGIFLFFLRAKKNLPRRVVSR